MIELPGWNGLISVNGFCYSSSMGESPKLNIPLKTSVAPTKGIAPATFARNSTATYIDNDGILQTAGIGVPRFQNGRYLVEPAGTNLVKYSGLLTNELWTLTNLDVTQDVGKNSFKVTNTATGACYLTGSYASYANEGYYTQSAELAKGNTNFASMTFPGTINSLQGYAVFNLDAGVVVKAVNCTAMISPYRIGTFICQITLAATTTTSGSSAIITPCREGSSRASGVSGDYIYANKIQTETGTKATSYIPTESAPVTRAADVLHYAVGDVITQGQGSLYCEFVGRALTGDIRRVLSISDNTLNNRITIYIDSSGMIIVYSTNGGVVQSASGKFTILSELNKVLLTYENNSTKFYLNGSLVYTDTACTIPTNLTKFNVGCFHDGLTQLNSEIGNVEYFKEVLTEAEAIKLTTL